MCPLYQQLLDEVFVISGIDKIQVMFVGQADISYRDLDYSGYVKNQ